LTALPLLLVGVHAQAVFVVTEPWIRPAQQAHSTEAYMELMSSDGATLIGARTPVAASVALKGVHGATGAPIALPLPATATVMLAPGKIRLALGKITRTLRIGDRVPLTLVIRDVSGGTQQIEVDAEVRLHSPTEDHLRPHSHLPPRA
jgi:copper(I)-binding protein